MSSQENDARVLGEAIAKTFFDEFEATNKSPTADELAALRERWEVHLSAQHLPWGAGDPWSELMLEAANNHFNGRTKFHGLRRSSGGVSAYGHGDTWHDNRPRAHPERGWSGPAGIARHDSGPTDE